MIRHGKTASGRQRFRCKACSSTQTRSVDTRARDFAAFLAFVTGSVRYQDLPGAGRQARRRFAQFWSLWPLSPLVDEIHPVIFVDAIYLRRQAAILIACTPTHVVGWYVARTERTEAWAALFSRIAAPEVVICDGGSGIASALRQQWPTTQVQRCTFHAFSQVKRYTTSRPRTPAGVELYELALRLLKVSTRAESLVWLADLTAWNTAWKSFLAQKTLLPDGRYVNTHDRLVRAKNTLNTLARRGTLFTYLREDLAILEVPATTNRIEGLNSRIRDLLRRHRGMRLIHQIKSVCWWLYARTEYALSPAQILAHTPTDEQITALFAQASHRAQAQGEINQWGTAVNWTDFHHGSPYRDDY